MAKKTTSSADKIAGEAVARLQLSIDADGMNRQSAIEALQFAAGDQWPPEIRMQRQLDRRPCLTINKTDTFIRNVVNNMRQQRPRIKVHPVGDGADIQIAEVIEGLIRHIEVSSNADLAYDTAADYQVRMGWGFWRIIGQYIDDKSFEQELRVERIRNPFSVYLDPSSQTPDGSDAEWCVITGKMKRTEFEKKYPKAKVVDISNLGAGDGLSDWATKEEIMVAEYYRIEEEEQTLLRLSDGKTLWADQITSEDQLIQMGVVVVDKRQSMRRVVKWSKITAVEELESRVIPGRYIPVIPVYGAEMLDNGKVVRYGMVRNLIDPQKSYNFWRTQQTEFVALAPKAPWLMAEGQDEGHEDEWDQANIKNLSRLIYKAAQDDNGQTLPPPQRTPPQQIPEASLQSAIAASEDLKAVAGMFDPSLGAPGQETSGAMVARRQAQADLSNFHFYDNLTRSIRWTGIILLEQIPHYYDTPRVIRIIGEDGNPDSVEINSQAVDKVLNDLTVGRYDVVMDTGPGYNTKRQESASMMIDMVKYMPQLSNVAGDLIVGQMDWPGAQMISERLAMANPLSQIDKQIPKDIDPKVKTTLAHLMAQNQQLQQQVQQLTQEKQAKLFGLQEREQAVTEREQMKESAETHRLHVRELGENLRAKMAHETKIHDTNTRVAEDWRESLLEAHTDIAIRRDLHDNDHTSD